MFENDNQLFEDLAIEYMDNLYSNAIRLVKSAKTAEDMVQQTYAVAFCVFEQFDKKSDFNKWLNEILMLVYKNSQFCHYEPTVNCLGKAVQVEQ